MNNFKKGLLSIFGLLVFLVILGSLSGDNPQSVPAQEGVAVASESPEVSQSPSALATIQTKSSPSPVTTKSPTPSPATNSYKVVKVVDGDTLDLNINGTTERIRLIGVNTPESVEPRQPVECFGIEASNRAKEILTGKTVILEKDPSQGDRDKYGRLLGYIFLQDGTNFGKKMISDGYAYEYTYDGKYKYQSEFKAAQADAQVNKRGLWADGACQQITPTSTPTQAATSACGAWCTSSHYSAKYYYCENDPGWQGLSPTYLKSFATKEELLAKYPSRTLHDANLCQ